MYIRLLGSQVYLETEHIILPAAQMHLKENSEFIRVCCMGSIFRCNVLYEYTSIIVGTYIILKITPTDRVRILKKFSIQLAAQFLGLLFHGLQLSYIV